METYKKRIDKCTDLEALFSVWKEAQSTEENYSLTFPGKGTLPIEFRNNWTDDGYLSDNRENIDILFILKEPNEQGAIDKEDEKVFGHKEFWIKNNINNFKSSICRRAYSTAKELIGNDLTEETWIYKAAIMNLNKRGGYNHTNNRKITNYVEKYKDFITKQIEIINPKIIVFMCGVKYSKEIINILDVSKYEVYCAPHPAAWGSDDNYLKKREKHSTT